MENVIIAEHRPPDVLLLKFALGGKHMAVDVCVVSSLQAQLVKCAGYGELCLEDRIWSEAYYLFFLPLVMFMWNGELELGLLPSACHDCHPLSHRVCHINVLKQTCKKGYKY